MRVDLSEFQEGAYADILDAVPYKVLKVATAVAQRENPSESDNDRANDITLKTMVRDWNVKDVLGAEVPIPSKAKDEQTEMVDGLIIGRIMDSVIKLVTKRKPDPNSENASSTS